MTAPAPETSGQPVGNVYYGTSSWTDRTLIASKRFYPPGTRVAKMPFWRFTFLSIAGIIPWVLAFGVVGEQVGHRWDDWQERLHYFDYVVLAGIVGGIAYLILRRRRRSRLAGEGEGASA